MDEAYYMRQADQERRRLEGHQQKVSRADGDIAKAEAAADKAALAATKASSLSMARSKQGEAKRHRNAAGRARDARAKASKAVADSQAKINGYERQARDAAARAAKKERDERQKMADRARREAAAEKSARGRADRMRAAQDAVREREVVELRDRTDQLEEQLRLARLAAPKEICVLFIAGSIEGDRGPLHLDREMREIDLKVQVSRHRDQIRFEQLQAAQIRDVIDGFNRYDPDIVHFSGHGDRNILMFEGPDGRPHELYDDQLSVLLGVARKPIRLVVLNACESAEQAAMAVEYVDAAIGMEDPIDDDSAKIFAGQLYGSLASGNSLANAFEQARAQAFLVNDDLLKPRLFVRSGLTLRKWCSWHLRVMSRGGSDRAVGGEKGGSSGSPATRCVTVLSEGLCEWPGPDTARFTARQ